ncbi:MAG TPA: glutamate synthase subunit beta [Polyangiaceae bacterium]
MGDPKGFLKLDRKKDEDRAIEERLADAREVTSKREEPDVRAQASRCMDCGIPFCHRGCPLENLIPEWNDEVYNGRFDAAAARLYATNNFPEVTGRICPAPCEASCVLNLQDAAVTIKSIEKSIADHPAAEAWYEPRPASTKTGKRIAVVGSGPAGLAAAQQLARAGHDVTVFERDDRVGGLLRYGIPDFKLEKTAIDRRVDQMEGEGVRFVVNAKVDAADLRAFDATVLAIGSTIPRDLPVEGRSLAGIHFAMELLPQHNKRVAGDTIPDASAILATGKNVVVIGGGDTGSDCVGTSMRQGAKSVVQLELMPKPPLVRLPQNPWPEWPLVLRTSSSHEEANAKIEGDIRDFAVSTKAILGDANGHVRALRAVRVMTTNGKMTEVEGSEFEIPCDLLLLAMGFVGPQKKGLVESLGLALDARGNVVSDASGATNVEGIFAAGDASRGQSLVVWAIGDGRRVASGVDAYLARAMMRAG